MHVFLIILLIFAGTGWAQPRSDTAISSAFAEAEALPAQAFRVQFGTQDLKGDFWADKRSNLSIQFGLGRQVELLVANGHRQLQGYESFKKGLGDVRLGLKWCALHPQGPEGLRLGFLGLCSIPSGYREQLTYYDSEAGEEKALPDFSLGQNAGEARILVDWIPSAGATLTGNLGYFSSSDRLMQAMRWGIGARLELGFRRLFSEFSYQNSTSRTVSTLLSDDGAEAMLGFRIGWGFSLLSGIRADMNDETLWGAAFALRFDGRIPLMQKTGNKSSFMIRQGMVLVAQPQSTEPLMEADELWFHIQEGIAQSFETAKPVQLSDLPGYSCASGNSTPFWNHISTLRHDYPEARWLLLTQLEREEITAQEHVAIPLLATIPSWEANCRLKVRLIDLQLLSLISERTVEGNAVWKRPVRLFGAAADDAEQVLTFDDRRHLTLQAYADAETKLRESLHEEP